MFYIYRKKLDYFIFYIKIINWIGTYFNTYIKKTILIKTPIKIIKITKHNPFINK